MRQKVNFREAKPQDLDCIMKIEQNSFDIRIQEKAHIYRERIEVFSEGFYIMEIDGLLKGYICSEIWDFKEWPKASDFTLNHSVRERHRWKGNELYLSSMGIAPEIRGGGYGKLLFNQFLSYVQHQFPQITSVLLLVAENWTNARRIYRENRFLEIEAFQYFFQTGETAIVMRKKIKKEMKPSIFMIEPVKRL